MQFKFFSVLFVFSAIIILSSCLDTTTPTTSSSDASFVSLTLAGNDSVKTAKFTLDGDGVTITNVDSLPYGTRIDSVYPSFSFKSSSKAVLHFLKNHTYYKYKFSKGSDSILITGKDTVDFRQALWTNNDSTLWVNNYASDGTKHNPPYKIKLNVHKVQPELYLWKQVENTNLNSSTAKNQNAIILNDKFYYYQNDGSSASVSTSTNGFNWSLGSLTGTFPSSTSLFDMIQFKGKLYISGDDIYLYSSANGLDWTKKSPAKSVNFSFKSLLFVLNNQLWATVKADDASFHFAISDDGENWNMTTGTLPENFPVTDFASLTFSTITGKAKVLVIGGLSGSGTLLKNFWSSEDGVYWLDFSNKSINPTSYNDLSTLAAGACVISYDNKLLLFGKTTTEGNFYRQSKDEGLSWQNTNYYNQIALGNEFKSPKTYKDTVVYYNYYVPHAYQSVVVDKSNRIYTIGGKSVTAISTDIWTGKLNRKSFAR